MSGTNRPTFYEILDCPPEASVEELRQSYKRLILQCHPDKLPLDEAVPTKTTIGEGDNVSDPNVVCTEHRQRFIAINEAWQTLKDSVKRRLYDAELLLTKFQMHSNIYERLTWSDMDRRQIPLDYEDVDEASVEPEEGKAKEGHEGGINELRTVLTYNCRCGGQYVVDDYDSVATFADKPTTTAKIGNRETADEVIVECSECSLVIIISNG